MTVNIRIDSTACGILAALLLFVVLWQGMRAPDSQSAAPLRSRSLMVQDDLVDPTFTPELKAQAPVETAAAPQGPADAAREELRAEAAELKRPKERLPTIFLSIAAYRDPECSTTMRSVLTNATHPERVHAAVCQQIKLPHEACLQRDTPHGDQVQVITVPFFEAKGPTVARHMVSQLYRNEDIFMQIDSHSRLVEGWDQKAVEMLARCPAKKCVVSHYPPVVDKHVSGVPIICRSHWDNGSRLPSFSSSSYGVELGQFMPTAFSGAGFILMQGEAVLEVPYDPNLNMMFVGEEILHSARLWTHGYDLFAPDENLVFHHYNRQENPNVFGDRPEEWWHPQQKSNHRARYILKLENEPRPETDESDSSYEYYGMGKDRTLDQYWAYAGIDPNNRNVTKSEALFCKQPEPLPNKAASAARRRLS